MKNDDNKGDANRGDGLSGVKVLYTKVLYANWKKDLDACSSVADTEKFFQHYLGKKGQFNLAFRQMVDLKKDNLKANLGAQINQEKQAALTLFTKKQRELAAHELRAQLASEQIDITLPAADRGQGAISPISYVQYRLQDIFHDLGFQVMDGPEIETDYYNFEALNFPKDHPARDTQDTFYLSNGNLLRTQTSNIQIRAMEQLIPPFQVVGPGKVFRAERLDAGHAAVFHQFEGMMVGKNVSVANLLYCLNTALSAMFEQEIKIRVRPGYFPFVEPGLEVDIGCIFCQGKGCSTCKHVGWLELLGCGLTHPRVLELGGIDPNQYSAFAFGIGIDRVAMLKFGIKDIRYFSTGNLHFAKQFIGVG